LSLLYEQYSHDQITGEMIDIPPKNEIVEVDAMFTGLSTYEVEAAQNKIYSDYVTSIKMRDREPLDKQKFFNHFFSGGNINQSIAFGSMKDGYLLGSDINGVFVPTHFAPAGLRQGYRLIKEVLEINTPTALFITQDLVETIQKMEGWKILPFRIETDFRGDVTEKTLVVSKWTALQRLASYHIAGIVRTKLSSLRWKTRKLGERAVRLLKHSHANAKDLDKEIEACFDSEENFRIENEYLKSDNKLAKLRDSRLFDEEDE